MLFTSLTFFGFLAGTLLVVACLPARLRWLGLLLASWLFYGFERPANLVWLAAVTLLVMACGRAMQNATSERARRAWMIVGVTAVVGALTAFKYYDFAAGELERLARSWANEAQASPLALPRIGLTAPAGFSFYAFTAIAYLVDVGTRRAAAAASPGHVALHLAFFPKLLAGPIERAARLLPQFAAGTRPDAASVVLGLQWIGWGLIKKVVIADNLAPVVDKAFGIAAYAAPVDLLIAVYFFAFQIYCDFSGYTDIAIGVALLFGIRLMENFRRPYLARSTGEFWASRWHVSLGTWFRDYLYVPLGGSRAGAGRTYLNLMLVFLVSGLWHAGLGYGVGWTFLVWGALNGAYQWTGVASRPLWRRVGDALPRVRASAALTVGRVLLTFHLIAITWIFFRAKSLEDAWTILRKIGMHLVDLPTLLARYPFTAEHQIGFALIALLLTVEVLDERRPVFERLAAAPRALRWGLWYAGLGALLIVGRWQAKDFIYMQF